MRSGRFDSRSLRAGRALVVLLSAAAIGGVVASAFLAWLGYWGTTDQIRSLSNAVGAHRVTRARLTGGFAYTVCRTSTPNDSLATGLLCDDTIPSAWPEARRLSKLSTRLHKAAAGRVSDAPRHHTLGSWNIVWGNPAAAVDEMRAAAQLDAPNAQIQNDLAVALLQRAALEQNPLAILDAYTAVDSALKLDPRLSEARFNRAVVLERLYLQKDAIDAWSSYLEVDGRSPWADEARARITQLRAAPPEWRAAHTALQTALAAGDETTVRRIVGQFPWRVRDQVRGTTIEWAQAYLGGDSSSRTLIDETTVLARVLEDSTNDALWADAARAITDATKQGNHARLKLTAHGLVSFRDGRAYLGALLLDSATSALDAARRSLSSSTSATAHLVDYDRARVSYQRQTTRGYDDALERLRRVLATTPDDYRMLRGLTTRTIGFVEALRLNYDVAISAFTTAIQAGSKLGEPILELRTPSDAVRLSAGVRGERAAWTQLYTALHALARYPDTPTDAQHLFALGAELSLKRSVPLALLFQQEAVRLAASMNDSLAMVTALTREARLFARMGKSAPGLQSLTRAYGYTAAIKRDSTREVMRADLDLVHGEILIHEQPDSAVRLLQEVVRRYRATQYLMEVGRAHLLLANAYAATGAMDSARRAFDAALDQMERERSTIGDLADRARFLDLARPVVDTVTRFLVQRGDTVDALRFVERMRARVLLERVRRGSPNSANGSVEAIRATLPAGTNIVSYAVLDREVVSWLIRRDRVSMHRVPVAGELDALIDRFQALIATGSEGREIRAVSARLYDLLIRPFADSVEQDSRLVLVPDKRLQFVPFAALFDERRGRFLVEAYEISVAPSLEIFAQSAARYDALRTTTAPMVLSVGNPSFDRKTYPLPSLPGAEREASRVAALYAGSLLLTTEKATRQAFLDAAMTANIIHFAGHGIVRPEVPLLSHLVLAPDAGPGSTGALYARDIFELKLPATRLAILSGCHTASGELSESEGVSSLARAFFAAGVPAVIASLWAIEDAATDEFFVTFHGELSRDQNPAMALRRTQQAWLAQKGDPWRSIPIWAAFQIFGATLGGR